MSTQERHVIISDPSLRDGSHAVRHQLTKQQVALYARAADEARVPIIEVGHGNGIGASSIQVGVAKEHDRSLLSAAREAIRYGKLGIHCIPGFATINKDLKPALDLGVDVVRVASHATEADTTQKHITYVRERGKEVFGVLMMSHMPPVDVLVEEALKMESYGAEAVIIMDSAGYFLPSDVTERVRALSQRLGIKVGFHGHNNLGMGVANAIAALEAGATILDGSARCFGAGAGNTQLEILVAVLHRMGHETGIDLYKLLDAADIAEKHLMPSIPTVKGLSIVSGLSGVFSGFIKPVEEAAAKFKVDARDIFFELGRRGIVAGQEDIIIEVASILANERTRRNHA